MPSLPVQGPVAPDNRGGDGTAEPQAIGIAAYSYAGCADALQLHPRLRYSIAHIPVSRKTRYKFECQQAAMKAFALFEAGGQQWKLPFWSVSTTFPQSRSSNTVTPSALLKLGKYSLSNRLRRFLAPDVF